MTNNYQKLVNEELVDLSEEEIADINQREEDHIKNSISEAKKYKIESLEKYYISNDVRFFNLSLGNSECHLLNDSNLRNLLLRNINILKEKIENNLITENEAIFNLKSSNGVDIAIPLTDLKQLIVTLEEKRSQQFFNKEYHKNTIEALSTEEDINNYNFESGW